MITNLQRNLKIVLEKPNPPKTVINSNDLIDIQVEVKADNINNCFVDIEFDTDYLKLVQGSISNTLGSGSFSKKLAWTLEGVKASDDYISTNITAQSDNSVQMASFPIKII